VCVLEIERVHDERAGELKSIADPQTGTVKIRQQEFIGVGVERVGVLDAGHQILQFWADESVAGVSGVHVKPDLSKKISVGEKLNNGRMFTECNTTWHSPPGTFYKPGRFL